VVIALVIAAFLERGLAYMELAERSNMETTVSHVNSAINTGLAYDMLEGRSVDVSAALKRNPFKLARMSPGNFSGEFDRPDLDVLQRGSWAYDRSTGELIYLPKLRRGFHTAEPHDAIRFRMKASGLKSYLLVPTSNYSWD
jgi:hypothetical protein